MTEGGHVCQHWASQHPHEHIYYPSKYPQLIENYCRNPDNTVTRPWCYTQSEDERWDFCQIKPCDMQDNLEGR